MNRSLYKIQCFWRASLGIALLWGVLVIAPATANASTVLIMGDSLSDAYRLPKEAGWVALLADRLAPNTEVINASISGETSAGGATRLPSLLKVHEPDVVVIILGGNDGLRALHPNQLSEHLGTMIEVALQSGARVGLMQIRLPPNLGPAYIERFEAVYPALAEQHGVTLLPFFLVDFFDQPGMLMDDGIHPTAQAQPKMFESVYPHIQALMATTNN
ncbi:MAG TPA: arylesterase [Wenzhouxiangella sp.]